MLAYLRSSDPARRRSGYVVGAGTAGTPPIPSEAAETTADASPGGGHHKRLSIDTASDSTALDAATLITPLPSARSVGGSATSPASHSRWNSTPTYRRPDLIASPSVRFLAGLEDASSDEDEEDRAAGVAAARIAEEEDWDALPSLLGADLATNFVLSMGAGGAPDIAPLAAQRGEGTFATSRLLCLGCDASESERVLRSFEEADDASSGCLVSMALVEKKPSHAVMLHSIPIAIRANQETAQRQQAFVNFLSELSEAARTPEQIVLQLELDVAASSDSSSAALDAASSPRARSRSRSRSGSSATALTRVLTKPFSVLSRPRYKAQAIEIVERLRDWGVRASVAPWSEMVAPPARPATSELQQQQQQPATLFSIHLRLSSEGASSSSAVSSGSSGTTDSLIKLVRQWLDPAPMPCLDYLLQDVRKWRQSAFMQRVFAPSPAVEPPTPLSPTSATSVSLVTPRAPRAPESANLDAPLSPIADDGEQDALDREMERIKRWTGATPTAGRSPQQARVFQEDEERKETEASLLAQQVASLQSQLAERTRAEEATESERLSLLHRLQEAETAQAKLVRDHLALQEQIKTQQAASATSSPPLSKSAQLKADRALAASLHRTLNGTALQEDTARRNMEKQRGLRALETGGNGAPKNKKLTQKEQEAQAAGLRDPHFDASSSPLAPVFDDAARKAESAAAEARALEAQRVRESKERAAERKPTEGALIKRSELFTMNHTEMRQLVSGLKEKHGVVVPPTTSQTSVANGARIERASEPPVAVANAAASDPVELPPQSDEKIDPALSIVEMKRAQSTQHWNAAHLPHMLAAVKRSALVPASRTEWAEAEKARAKAELAKMKDTDDEAKSGGAEAEEKSSLPASILDASTSSGSRTGAPRLIAYSSGKLYDKLTGVPVEDLDSMSVSERLRRAEERVEEVEMDDMYRRFLQPRTSELSAAGAKSPERDAHRHKKDKAKRRRASAHAIPGSGNALLSPTSPLNKLPAAAATASAKEATSRRRSMATTGVTANVSTAAGAGTIDLTADAPVNSAALLGSKTDRDGTGSDSSSRDSRSDGLYWVDLLASASGLDNPFLLGKPDPYLEVYRRRQYIWELVATSETAPRTLDANWGSILCSVEALCNMQLDRKILFKVWTANRMQGRTLLGELCISLTQIQENVGSRFKLTVPLKNEGEAQGTRVSGTLRFHHAELCVNSTKPSLIFRGLNVKDPSKPSFTKLSSCLVRMQLAAEGLPLLGRFAIFKEKPDPYLEVFRMMPDGRWDTSVLQYHDASTARSGTLANASASGSVGGCLWRSEPAFKTTRPKYPVFVLPLWALCFGDVNRPLRVRVRHKDQTLGWLDITLKEMCLAHQAGKKVPLRAVEPSPAPPTSTATTTASEPEAKQDRRGSMLMSQPVTPAPDDASAPAPPQRTAGFLLLKHVSIYSHLSELPVLCANAGIERKPVPGVSNLPLRQLISQQVRASLPAPGESKPGMARAASRVQSQRSSVESLGSASTAVASLDADEKAAAEIDAAAAASGETDLDAVFSSSREVRRNVYRGLHHIRAQCASKFFTSMAPVKARVLEARQMAMLMGGHARLGADSVMGRHFLKSEIFDPNLIPFIFTFLGAEMPTAGAPASVATAAASKAPPTAAAASTSLPLSPRT